MYDLCRTVRKVEILFIVSIAVAVFGTVCCLQFEINGVKIRYKVTKYDTCNMSPVNRRLVTLPSVSVSECVYQCAISPKCEGLNYRRKFKRCDLVSENGDLETFPHCWFIKRSDIVVGNSQCDKECGDECDGNGKCISKVNLECGYPEIPYGRPAGNMFAVGDTQVVECDSGFSIQGSKKFKCLENGTWDKVPECRKECNSADLLDFHNADVQPFNNSSGSYAHVKCHGDYVSNGTEIAANKISEETVRCANNGTWIPNIDCIYIDNLFNVAWNRATSQSSNYIDSAVSAKAADGIWNPHFHNNSCSHTQVNVEEIAWWEVDLKQVYVIRKVKILNRASAIPASKLRQVTVTIGNLTNPTDVCAVYVGPAVPSEKVELVCERPIGGQFVRLSKNNTGISNNLALCEVGIYEQ